jgi:hypothetical protein
MSYARFSNKAIGVVVMKLKKMLKERFTIISSDSAKLHIYFGIFILLALGIVGYITINSISTISVTNARDTNISLIRQTAKNMDIVLDQIDKYAANLSSDNEICKLLKEYNTADKNSQLEIRNKINNRLKNNFNSHTEFVDAYIYNNNKQIFNWSDGIHDSFFEEYAVKKFKEESKNSLWVDTYISTDLHTKTLSVKVITLMKSMFLLSNLENLGTLMINIPEVYLDNVLKDVKIGYKGSFFVYC